MWEPPHPMYTNPMSILLDMTENCHVMTLAFVSPVQPTLPTKVVCPSNILKW